MPIGSGIRNRYHLAINGNGFMLRGGPDSVRYTKETAPALVNQLGSGDLDYNKLNGSGWSYWTQTDWSGGFQTNKFRDDASFFKGQAIDPISKYGEIKLQSGFISAVKISGQTFNSHSVHKNQLLIGTVKSGSAKLMGLSGNNTLSTLSAYTGISAVNSLSRFNDVTLIGLTRTSGSLKTFAKYDGNAVSAFRSSSDIVRAVKGIGIRAYYSEYSASLSGDQLGYSTDLSAFTSAYNAGKGREIPKIVDINGVPHFFITEGNKVELYQWDEQAEKAYSVYEWKDLINFGITKYLSFVAIAGETAGKHVAFAYNGARLWQIFDDKVKDGTYNFKYPFEYDGNLQTKGAMWDGKFWFPGLYGTYNSSAYIPFENFANRAYGFVKAGSDIRIAHISAGHYEISGHIESSEFGNKIGGVDKLVNTVDINMEPLSTGESIEMLYSTDNGSSYKSIGVASFSNDGAVKSKHFKIPSGFVTKLWKYKPVLVGNGASTPKLGAVTFEYRAFVDLKKRWRLLLDANDEIMLLNGQKEERDAKELISKLWMEKEAKRYITYEDVDSYQVSLVSAMTSSNTSARISGANLRYMPQQGRIRVVSGGVAEEMTYTSAEGTIIKGISRAQKGTKARAYTSAHKFDNFYTAIVTNVNEQIIETDEKQTFSVASVVLLEV